MGNNSLESWFENDRKKRREKFNRVVDNTKKEFFPMQEKKIKKIYKSVIDDFYADYRPHFYNRRDNGSLYKLLKCRSDTEHIYMSFDPSEISYRNGYAGEDGLYRTVFIEGWHGGAMVHNSMLYPVGKYENGKPRAYDGTYKDGVYKPYEDEDYKYSWTVANRASISPLDDFNKRFDDYQDTEFEEDFRDLFDKNLRKENL